MKIIQKIHQAPTKIFANMPTGEVFKWENTYFMKVQTHSVNIPEHTEQERNALNLETNALAYFRPEDVIIPIKAELTVDY